ncbi:unnamed protein product [Didymodactylos carnosus]|uniref:ADP-ribosylglycohydrolase n=1 Tax=Didymodactylos carnosus TaxID=1234261 RepID=A0A815BEH7_9BILA|nr:unnamed protein product [Didymodactylos carnosus]CAF4054267.1 unnamed protein product [Didymodactylos carnosus]
MALCLANSLIARHDFVPYDQLVRYKWWYRNGYMSSTGHCFDIGAATRQSLQEFERRQRKFAQDHNIPFNHMDFLSDPNLLNQFDVNCSKDGVAGNGALMRLTPVPLFFHRYPEIAVEYSGISGRITHGDEKAYDACRYYGALIVAALSGVEKNELISDTFYDVHKQWFGKRTLHSDIMEIARGSFKKHGGYEDGIRGKGYVVKALEAALWAFWSEDSFEKGALNAVNLGDDTDTTAAIYGQLAGAHYGYRKLPSKWLQCVYANNFMHCLSSWITYEGEKWFTNQKTPDMTKPSNHSSLASRNTTSNTSIVSKQDSDLSSESGSIIDGSLATSERKAIDPSGHIGLFYDAWHDCILKSPSISIKPNAHSTALPPKCLVERGDKPECQNLLRFIGFDDELRLSVQSAIAPPTGIASLVQYPFLIDECTRVLYYSYLVRHEALPDEINNARKNIQRSTCETVATHVITGVNWGIDILILLRLPPDDPKMIDDTLNNICQYLNNDTKLSRTDSLDRILEKHIYSNAPELTKKTTIVDVCHAIHRLKNDPTHHQPVSYILQPIKVFYPNGNKNDDRFIPFEPKTAQRIEKHLLRLSCVNKMWLTILSNEISDVLKKDLTEQLNEACDLKLKLANEYDKKKETYGNAILNIRQGKYSQEGINHHLLIDDDQEITWKRSIDDLKYWLTMLKKKECFIMEWKTRGFEYWNAIKCGVEHGDDDNTIERKLMKNDRQRILCSNDTLNENNWSTLEMLCSRMINERLTKPDLCLVYADFAYYVLASRSAVRVLVSFVALIKNDFEHHFVRSGNPDPNEDHDHPGQSTTLRCKSAQLSNKHAHSDLTMVNACIERVEQIPMVRKQMDAVRKMQETSV